MPRIAAHQGAQAYAPSLDEPRYSSSLERGLLMLECFTANRPVLGIADVADELGMSRSTTHRYMCTLVELGYLRQGPGRKYRLAFAVTQLGMSALNATSLREHAHQYLQELQQQTSYTTAIAVLDGTSILCIDHLPSRHHPEPARLGRWSRLPIYCTAIGKVLLASLPDYVQRTLIHEIKFKRHTPNTITSKTALRTELDLIAEEGIAVNDQELYTDTHAIAAPVRDEVDTVAVICILAPTPAIPLSAMVEHLTPHLLATADRISARLGHRHTHEQNNDFVSSQPHS